MKEVERVFSHSIRDDNDVPVNRCLRILGNSPFDISFPFFFPRILNSALQNIYFCSNCCICLEDCKLDFENDSSV